MFQTGWLEELNKSVEKAIKEVNLNIRQVYIQRATKRGLFSRVFQKMKNYSTKDEKRNSERF